jgi:tetratricopeptide (TPR) repeat protein
MRTLSRILSIGTVSVLLIAAPRAPHAAASESGRTIGDLGKVGAVHFPTSCDPKVQAEFERALALLHSFFYEEARRVFTEVAEKDPKCAMALWGIAMTYYHPLWTEPDSAEFAAGLAAIRAARSLGGGTDTERDFVAALEAFYTGEIGAEVGDAAQSCHGPIGGDYKACALAYQKALGEVHAKHPDNTDAAALFALQLVATATPGDALLTQQKRAVAILEPLYEAEHDHPGLTHYLIHANDYPPLAKDGLPAAQAYASIAPWVPHALHMPSHIFTRLGMWEETIESNLAAASAARDYAAKYHPGVAYSEELHAMDYTAYAYLQTTQDHKVKELLDHLAAIRRTRPENEMILAYACGALPARYTLERREWKEAAHLVLPDRPFWARFPFAEAHVVYARAIGAARAGDREGALRAIARLDTLSAAITNPKFRYFREHVATQRRTASGILAIAEGRRDEGLDLLRRAATVEDSLGKHPVSPGALLPARELLAEALLDAGRPAEALAEFEASLKLYPARFNGVAGAARAAEMAGDGDKARRYYEQVIALGASGDGERPELARAREFVSRR